MRNPRPWLFLLALFAGFAAQAHQLGEGYVFLDVEDDAIKGRVELTLASLDTALELDGDKDGKVSDEEFTARGDDAEDYVFSRFGLGEEGSWYDVASARTEIANYPLGRYALFHFAVDGIEKAPQLLQVKYEILFDKDSKHRGLVIVEYNALTGERNRDEAVSLIIAPGEPVRTLDLLDTSASAGVLAFIWHGIWHIWIGIDHIAFLLVLLLQSVLTRDESKWKPVADFKPALYNAAKIVTLFTIAHTVTLTMAALNIVTLPPRLVESVIAASIVVAAILNFFPSRTRQLYMLIFIFGLFHGFGFAGVLRHLTTQSGTIAYSLLGFNLGVELGQLTIVLVCFPVLYMLRSQRFYQPLTLKFGSAAISAVAMIWFVERAFDVGPIIGF